MSIFGKTDEELQKEAWEVIDNPASKVGDFKVSEGDPDFRNLGRQFLDSRREHHEFLSTEGLKQAEADRTRVDKGGGKANVDDGSVVYIFIRLSNGISKRVSKERKAVLKVGQTGDGPQRIVSEHLRSGTDKDTVRGYYKKDGWTVADALDSDEIVLIIFSFPHNVRQERLAIEASLKGLLRPEIG